MPGTNSKNWTTDAIPDLSGKVAVVTGANSGLGFETTRALARAGAHVVAACRNAAKAETALEAIRKECPQASLEAMPLDLASLAQIESFAKSCLERHPRIGLLCNNAGVMAIPLRRTADGFEMQLGTNHLGHFALTGRLLPALLDTPGARIVNVSSTAHKIGSIHFDDLQWERRYQRWPAYGQSKLANLLFTYELQRKLARHRAEAISVASHPGYAATNLQFVGPQMDASSLAERVMGWANGIFAQDAAAGALPTLYAATAADVIGGDYIGPSSIGEIWGAPKKVRSSARSYDVSAAARLFDESERLTGVDYGPLGGRA